MEDMLAIDTAAKMLGMTKNTVRTWATNGKIQGAVQHGPRTVWFIPRSEVDRIIEERETTSRQSPSRWVPMTERDGQIT